MSNEPVTLSKTDLKDIIAGAVAAAVAEAKKPYVSEDDLKRIESEQNARAANADLLRQEHENKQRFKRTCTHKRRDGSNRTVWVSEGLGSEGYILCQKCQAVIRPGTAPKDYKGTAIYDTVLYNTLFQTSSDAGIAD